MSSIHFIGHLSDLSGDPGYLYLSVNGRFVRIGKGEKKGEFAEVIFESDEQMRADIRAVTKTLVGYSLNTNQKHSPFPDETLRMIVSQIPDLNGARKYGCN